MQTTANHIEQLSWGNVLQTKSHIGHINKLFEHAVALGYQYFLWNDQVYRVISDNQFEETSMGAGNII